MSLFNKELFATTEDEVSQVEEDLHDADEGETHAETKKATHVGDEGSQSNLLQVKASQPGEAVKPGGHLGEKITGDGG